MFKTKNRKVIFKDEWLTFYNDEIKLPDETKGKYSWVDRKNGAGIVVITTDNKILLTREYRYVIGAYSWEIPGGGIDKGETAEVAAKRELYEETGIRAKRLKKLGMLYPLSSFNTESVTMFYGIFHPNKPTDSKTESGEQVAEYKYVSFSKALKLIDAGEISDSITAAAVQMAIRKLQKKS